MRTFLTAIILALALTACGSGQPQPVVFDPVRAFSTETAPPVTFYAGEELAVQFNGQPETPYLVRCTADTTISDMPVWTLQQWINMCLGEKSVEGFELER